MIEKNEIKTLIEESEEFIKSIIEKKYLHNGEKNWEDVCKRFKNQLENTIEKYYFEDLPEKIYNLMKDKKYIPAGSILYGFGFNKDESLSLSNCYFIPIEKDSIEGIYEFMKKQARTYSWRGGVGTDISILRPKNAKVNNSAKTSSGSVSFMPLFSENTNTIGQNGRRGAHIITIEDWHPDILDFVSCKSEPQKVFDYDYINKHLPNVYYANISVKLSDKFFKSVENNEKWILKFPDIYIDKDFYNKKWNGDIIEWEKINGKVKKYNDINAKDLLRKIAESSWKSAEPGVLYWDNVQKYTPLAKIEEYKPRGVNPCGEQILGNYQNCNLHAIVLYKYVLNPFTENAKFDFKNLLNDIRYVYDFADYVVTHNNHPLKEQNETDKNLRKIGIEFTGLADMLAMLNLKYGTDESIEFVNELMGKIANNLWDFNLELSKFYGCAPIFKNKKNIEKFLSSEYFKRANIKVVEEKKDEILKYGFRNSAILNSGPTGSISIIADNCSSGIEPVFMLTYKRNSRLLQKETKLIHLPLMKFLAENAPEDLNLSLDELKEKYNYVEANELDYIKRIKMQSIIQKWVTDSISSTINLPENITIEEIEKIYLEGWKAGLKGLTIYRMGSIEGILNEDKNEENENKKNKKLQVNGKFDLNHLYKKELFDEEKAVRYVVKWKGIKVYIIMVYDDLTGNPLEIFAQLPIEAGIGEDGIFRQELYMERLSYWHAISRLLSLAFMYDIPLDDIRKQLKKSSYSIAYLPAILMRILNKFPLETPYDEDIDIEIEDKNENIKGSVCPVCGKKTLIKEGGCNKCLSCGYSKCE